MERNLLIQLQGNQWVTKVADFGLSKLVHKGLSSFEGMLSDDISLMNYLVENELLPLRWTAPEILTARRVSKAGDVWSFGVVLWEILEVFV